ncbi:MAG: GNAT family N-acetyltransferase [Flavisolibacter sp.]
MDSIQIVNTTAEDWEMVVWLFEQALQLQGKKGYMVWSGIDLEALKGEMDKKLQYKIIKDQQVVCLFSARENDPLIWGERDRGDAVYLHRIVVHPDLKGQRLFEIVLDWAIQSARQHGFKYVRMDTWAENNKIIEYYKGFGFSVVENYRTNDAAELPLQNRNLNVALLEKHIG